MSSHARLLIVDDNAENVRLLTAILRSAGYEHIEAVFDAHETVEYVTRFNPDLILLDLMMIGLSGHDVLTQLHQILPADSFLPVLVITADYRVEARQQALSLGATDFLLRPHEIFDVTLRVRNLLQTRFLHLEVLNRNEILETEVRERTRSLAESRQELKLAQLDVIERLAQVGEHHDDDTGQHTRRVARLSRLLGQQLGLDLTCVEMIRRAAPLHDVGKIGVPDTILKKPGRLTIEEFDEMKKHCVMGAQILSGGRSELLEVAQTIALSHHERWEGSGYPHGLGGDKIPISGRVVAVADVFDALTHNRPYKQAWTVEAAMEEIRTQSGRQFDPEVVEVFCSLLPEQLSDQYEEPADTYSTP